MPRAGLEPAPTLLPNGSRIRLAPQKDWAVNNPDDLNLILKKLEKIQADFNRSKSDGTQISLADLIVLGGNTAIEVAAQKAGVTISLPFHPGRNDATQDQTDSNSFNVLEPKADGFRNYFAEANSKTPAEMLVYKSSQLNLTVPEMTVLVGGMRAFHTNVDHSKNGMFTSRPETLSNDFFVNLLDMSTQWKPSESKAGFYEGVDRKTGQVKWNASPVDLIFGFNSELRAVAEVYAYQNSEKKFVNDFAAAWTKVMELDRFDLKKTCHSSRCAIKTKNKKK